MSLRFPSGASPSSRPSAPRTSMLEPGRVLEPGRLQIFEEPFPAALAPEAAFAVAAESAGRVEKIGAVDPNHSGFQLRGHVQRHVDALAPNTRGESIYGI